MQILLHHKYYIELDYGAISANELCEAFIIKLN